MDWSTLGAIGEFVGGIAVIVTLFYLALQLRQNTNQFVNSGSTLASEGGLAARVKRTGPISNDCTRTPESIRRSTEARK